MIIDNSGWNGITVNTLIFQRTVVIISIRFPNINGRRTGCNEVVDDVSAAYYAPFRIIIINCIIVYITRIRGICFRG